MESTSPRFPQAETPFSLKHRSVDYQSLLTKIARLRAELQEMGTANRKYFQKKSHSRAEPESHLLRQERIQQIKAELEARLGRSGK